MDDIKEKLEGLEHVDGFIAAGAMDAKGVLMVQFSPVKEVRWKEISGITSDVLRKTQKFADIIGIGKTRFVHITSSEGNILAQCLEKRPNDSATTVDRIVVFLSPKGNTALGKLRLHSLVKEISGKH